MTSLLLLATSAHLVLLQSLYHRIVDTRALVASVTLGLALVGVVFWAARRVLGDNAYRWVARTAIAVSTLVAANSLVVARLPVPEKFLSQIEWGLMTLACVVGAAMFARMPLDRWRRMRLALAVASVVFAISGVVLGWVRAPTVLLFESAPTELARPNPPRAIVLLLLDELSASASGELVASLRASGLQVQYKAVPAVGHGTSEVIPSMLSHQVFVKAIACGWTTICGNQTSLDFSKISMARPDVDFAGFFHPYCVMKGLRYCHFAPFADSPERWTCRLARRVGDLASLEIRRCQQLATHQWTDMTEDVISGALNAPLWSQGGLLFAHVPLPHPPGTKAGAGLQDDYLDNLRRANTLIKTMVDRLRSRFGGDFRLIVTSDHPLRHDEWCAHFLYRYSGCEVEAGLLDTLVPIIVASDRPQSMITIKDNGAILQLVE